MESNAGFMFAVLNGAFCTHSEISFKVILSGCILRPNLMKLVAVFMFSLLYVGLVSKPIFLANRKWLVVEAKIIVLLLPYHLAQDNLLD
jgi:hypothetical protein